MKRLTCYHEIVMVEQMEFDIVVPDDATDEQIKAAAAARLDGLALNPESPNPYSNDEIDDDYTPGETMPSLMNDVTVFMNNGSRLSFSLNERDERTRWFGADGMQIGLKPSALGASIYVNERNFAPFEIDSYYLDPANLETEEEQPYWQLCVYFPDLDEPIAKLVWLGNRVVVSLDREVGTWTEGAGAEHGFHNPYEADRSFTAQFTKEDL
jgi:hypothetical protein